MKISDTWKECLSHKQNSNEYRQFYLYRCGTGLCEPPKKWFFYSGGWYLYCNPRSYLEWIPNKYFAKGEYNTYKKFGVKFPKFDSNHRLFYYNFNGDSFNPNLSKYASMYCLFDNVVGWDKISSYCEIGSGYGGMVELLECNTKIDRYVLIDFPEMLEIAKIYLEKYNNVEYVTVDNFNKISNVNMFLNSDSFVEMLPSTIEDYFSFMQSFENVYLLSYNRTNRGESGYINSEYTLPYDNRWKTLFSRELKISDIRIHSDTNIRISKR